MCDQTHVRLLCRRHELFRFIWLSARLELKIEVARLQHQAEALVRRQLRLGRPVKGRIHPPSFFAAKRDCGRRWMGGLAIGSLRIGSLGKSHDEKFGQLS
jgi:hypothetical protein